MTRKHRPRQRAWRRTGHGPLERLGFIVISLRFESTKGKQWLQPGSLPAQRHHPSRAVEFGSAAVRELDRLLDQPNRAEQHVQDHGQQDHPYAGHLGSLRSLERNGGLLPELDGAGQGPQGRDHGHHQ
jgi:hypothetical protein